MTLMLCPSLVLAVNLDEISERRPGNGNMASWSKSTKLRISRGCWSWVLGSKPGGRAYLQFRGFHLCWFMTKSVDSPHGISCTCLDILCGLFLGSKEQRRAASLKMHLITSSLNVLMGLLKLHQWVIGTILLPSSSTNTSIQMKLRRSLTGNFAPDITPL